LELAMKEPSEARKRTLALQARAITFSTNVNRSYSTAMNYPSEIVWNQLVRAADGTLNNLVEADHADELAAIYSTIITNMEIRLSKERDEKKRNRRRKED
jgi:hypothetical protein